MDTTQLEAQVATIADLPPLTKAILIVVVVAVTLWMFHMRESEVLTWLWHKLTARK